MNLDLDLLASIASGGLGHWVEGAHGTQTYVKDDDCIACLRDLQAIFRGDDAAERPAFFAVSKYNFARSDLVPLIVTYPEDYDVVFNALKVCAFLTMPASGPRAGEPTQEQQHAQQVCEAFLARDALAVIVSLVADPLSRHPRMSERDVALVQLVITFLRNLLVATVVPPAAPAAAAMVGRRIKQGLLERLFDDHVLDLILLVAQHACERPFKSEAPVLVDLFLHLFCGVTAEQLLNAAQALQTSVTAAAARTAPVPARRAAAVPAPVRPPKSSGGRTVASFGPSSQAFASAVYVRRHLDHTANVVLRHNPHRRELPALRAGANSKQAKSHVIQGTNLARNEEVTDATGGTHTAEDGGALRGGAAPGLDLRTATLAARLDGYLTRFLEEAYTPLLGQVQKELRPGLDVSRLSDSDFQSFAQLATLCTRYVRLREERRVRQLLAGAGQAALAVGANQDRVSPFTCISATMGWDSFHFVQVLWMVASEGAGRGRVDHETGRWSLRHSLAPLLKEMLLAVDLARVAGNAADRAAADRLQRRLLHDESKDAGLLPMVTGHIKNYNYRFQPRSHAVDLLELLHIILTMLDRLSTAETAPVGVQQTVQLQGPPDSVPQAGDEQQRIALGAEKAGDAATGEGTGIAAGTNDDDSEKGGLVGGSAVAAMLQAGDQEEEPGRHTAGEEEQEELHQESAVLPPRGMSCFQADPRIRRQYAQPVVIHVATWLLQGYRTNAPFTNHALVCFLDRVTKPAPKGLGLAPMLWQLSALRLFQTIMSDPAVRRDPVHADLLALCSRVTRSVLTRAVPELYAVRDASNDGSPGGGEEGGSRGDGSSGNCVAEGDACAAAGAVLADEIQGRCASMLFVELLFWKGPIVAEALEAEYNWKKMVDFSPSGQGQQLSGAAACGGQLGFASYRAVPRRAMDFAQTEAEELHAAFESCNGKKTCLNDLVAAFDGRFKRVHISRQLKSMGLERGKLTAGQSLRVRQLYEEHSDKGRSSRLQAVAEGVGAGFSANQIKRHLGQLGVVEVGRPSATKRRSADAWGDMLGSDASDHDEHDGEAGAVDVDMDALPASLATGDPLPVGENARQDWGSQVSPEGGASAAAAPSQHGVRPAVDKLSALRHLRQRKRIRSASHSLPELGKTVPVHGSGSNIEENLRMGAAQPQHNANGTPAERAAAVARDDGGVGSVKTLGRRLLKRAGPVAAPEPAAFEDLEDF